MTPNHLTLLAVHAHPDDEVFSTGGVYARAADEGIHTVLVCCTGGEEGEIHDPDLNPDTARERLAEIRENELRRACDILGIRDLYFLGYRDSGMAGTPANTNPENFLNAHREEAVGKLVRLFRQVRPDVVVTYDERGSYGHPDHITAHEVTVAAVEAAADATRYPDTGASWQVSKLYFNGIPRGAYFRFAEAVRERGLPSPFGEDSEDFLEFLMPDEEITTVVDVQQYVDRKREALRAHRTQIPADDMVMRLPDDLAALMLGTETFARAASTVPTTDPEDDLFSGLRG